MSFETLFLFTEAQELRSGEQSQAEQETRRDLWKLGVLGKEGSPPPNPGVKSIWRAGRELGSRFHVFSWEELTHEVLSSSGLSGPGTCTEGPSRDERGAPVADGVARPAAVGEGLVPGSPGCAEDRAFVCRVNPVLPGHPAVGHVQACLRHRASQGHVTGTVPRGLKAHSDGRLRQPTCMKEEHKSLLGHQGMGLFS